MNNFPPSFQALLADNHPTIAAHRPTRWSLIALARRQNAKLKANAPLTRDSRSSVDDSIVYRRRRSAEQSPAARNRARLTLQLAVSALSEARWKQVSSSCSQQLSYRITAFRLLTTCLRPFFVCLICAVCWSHRTDNVQLEIYFTNDRKWINPE